MFFDIWVVIMWFVPSMLSDMHGWEASTAIEVLKQSAGALALALAVIFCQMPTYAGDNLKQAGMLIGVGVNLLLFALVGYHMTTEMANFDPATLPTIVLTALFF